jgi:hypothetical protein
VASWRRPADVNERGKPFDHKSVRAMLEYAPETGRRSARALCQAPI